MAKGRPNRVAAHVFDHRVFPQHGVLRVIEPEREHDLVPDMQRMHHRGHKADAGKGEIDNVDLPRQLRRALEVRARKPRLFAVGGTQLEQDRKHGATPTFHAEVVCHAYVPPQGFLLAFLALRTGKHAFAGGGEPDGLRLLGNCHKRDNAPLRLEGGTPACPGIPLCKDECSSYRQRVPNY